jgi:hypothetical protein
MPVVTTQVSNLQAIGPILDVKIGPNPLAIQAMLKKGSPVPAPIAVSALIDTGASNSLIQSGLPQKIGMFPISMQFINTPSSENVPCMQYFLRLMFFPTGGLLMPVHFDSVFVEAPLKGQNIQCLLGRDFLSQAVLTYVGPTNSFVLSL